MKKMADDEMGCYKSYKVLVRPKTDLKKVATSPRKLITYKQEECRTSYNILGTDSGLNITTDKQHNQARNNLNLNGESSSKSMMILDSNLQACT